MSLKSITPFLNIQVFGEEDKPAKLVSQSCWTVAVVVSSSSSSVSPFGLLLHHHHHQVEAKPVDKGNAQRKKERKKESKEGKQRKRNFKTKSRIKMALNCWSKPRRGTTSAETIPKVQDVQDSLNTNDVGTVIRIARHHHPPTGYLQATGQFHTAVSIQELRLLIMKIVKLRHERSMTSKVGKVEKFKVRKLVKTQLQMKIVLKLHFKR